MPTIISWTLFAVASVLLITIALNELLIEQERLRQLKDQHSEYENVIDSFENRYESNAGDPIFLGGGG